MCKREQKNIAEGGFAKTRKCRDLLFALLLILFWAGMIGIGIASRKYGEPQRLVYGSDYTGKTCGMDTNEGRKYVAYPRANTEDFIANIGKTNPLEFKFYGICVSSCPQFGDVVCNYQVPLTFSQQNRLDCIVSGTSGDASVPCSTVVDNCWITPLNTSSIMYRCIPEYTVYSNQTTVCSYPSGIDDPNDPRCATVIDYRVGSVERPARTNFLFDQMNTARQTWGRWFGDLSRAWWVILLSSVGIGLVLGFIWLIFAKLFTRLFVWGTIFIVLVALGFFTGYAFYKGGVVQVSSPFSFDSRINSFGGAVNTITRSVQQQFGFSDEEAATAWRIIGYISVAVCLIAVSMVVALRRRISTAVEMIKLGSEALKANMTLVLFPFLPALGIAAFLIYWIFIAACLASSGNAVAKSLQGDVVAGMRYLEAEYGNVPAFQNILNSSTINATITTIEDVPALNYFLIYHFFGLLWTTQFIQGLAIMTVAGVVGGWYFSLNEKNNPAVEERRYKQPRLPICSSLGRALFYNFGTIAFGSLLIAFMQFIRAVVAYVLRKMKSTGGNQSSVTRFAACCVQCFLKCLQSCVEMVTRNAYIFSAIKGTSFCASGKQVFSLITSNAATLALVNVIGELLMFLGKVFIAMAGGWCAFAIMDNYPGFKYGEANYIYSQWIVILVTVFFAYAVASSFMSVFDMAVDTVLVCYVIDPHHVKDDKLGYGGKAAHKGQPSVDMASYPPASNPIKSGQQRGAVTI